MHLVQFNIAHAKYPLEDPRIQDFVQALEAINRLAEEQSGFIWRFQSALSDEVSPWPKELLPNMSVWESCEALLQYVYRTDHSKFLRRKSEWFHPIEGPHMVLWWAAEGEQPTLAEAKRRLSLLEQKGAGPEAFTFTQRFDPNGERVMATKRKRAEATA